MSHWLGKISRVSPSAVARTTSTTASDCCAPTQWRVFDETLATAFDVNYPEKTLPLTGAAAASGFQLQDPERAGAVLGGRDWLSSRAHPSAYRLSQACLGVQEYQARPVFRLPQMVQPRRRWFKLFQSERTG
jgi:hypothetical protein